MGSIVNLLYNFAKLCSFIIMVSSLVLMVYSLFFSGLDFVKLVVIALVSLVVNRYLYM